MGKRISIYTAVVVVCALISLFGKWLVCLHDNMELEGQKAPVMINTRIEDADVDFTNQIMKLQNIKTDDGIKISFNYMSSIDNLIKPDLIIKRSSNEAAPEGYIKHEKLLYSPIICYAISRYVCGSDLVKEIEQPSDITAYQMYLYRVFNEFLNSGSFKNIETSNHDCFRGDIDIIMTDMNDPNYNDIRNFISLVLYDRIDQTNETMNDKIASFVSKTKTRDMAAFIKSCKNFDDSTIAIAPEYMAYNRANYVYPVYGYQLKTNALFYDVYIKDEEKTVEMPTKDGSKMITFDMNKELVNYMQTKPLFFDRTGIRVKNRAYTFADTKADFTYHMFDYADIIDVTENALIANR